MRKIVISLDGQELSALNVFAQRERRDSREQAALIIRTELERRGLLPVNAEAMTQRDAGKLAGVSNASAH